MMDDTDGRLLLTFTLCMRCRFGDRCPGMQKAPAAGGGITCSPTSRSARPSEPG